MRRVTTNAPRLSACRQANSCCEIRLLGLGARPPLLSYLPSLVIMAMLYRSCAVVFPSLAPIPGLQSSMKHASGVAELPMADV